MKKLIIAEKPSLAKNICAAITPALKWVAKGGSKTGYWENDDYIVSYAFGHLLQLNSAADYNEEYKTWSIDVLPIIPAPFAYKQSDDAGARAQLRLLKELIARKDVDSVINAGDSDREGEIIVRNILEYAKCKKPVYRLWMPDQTPQTISAELAKMSPDSQYDNLANEGYARTFIDWLYGINLTRLVTKRANILMRVGRVTSPIIAIICERERAIRNFKPEEYFVATYEGEGFKLISKSKFDTVADCDALCAKYNASQTKVDNVKQSKHVMARPKLFALSDLQGVAGKTLKFSPQDTLTELQHLYENGYCSYPRTNSRYMAVAEKQKARDIIAAVTSGLGITGIAFRDTKDVFDDSKIESHSAITPTYKVPAPGTLPPRQQQIYDLILNRFCAAFCVEDYAVNRTEVSVSNDYESFKLTGDVLVSRGYTVFEASTKKDTLLPPFTVGDIIPAVFESVRKETTPPDHFSAETLNTYLKNPYSKDEKKSMTDEEDVEVVSEVELGTEATRAGLIDGAIKSGYITLSKNRYGITENGEYYVDMLANLGIDMTKERTLNLSKALKAVYRNTKTIEDVVASAVEDLNEICARATGIEDIDVKPANRGGDTSGRKVLCKCPVCGKNILESSKAWGCEDSSCGCVLFKNDNFFARQKKKMTATIAKSLFTKGYADVSGFTSTRTGKSYNARVNVKFEGVPRRPQYELDFGAFKK